MSRPIISIITPCYNAEKTIRQAIESVLAQTFTDWELIVIDDFSTDKSATIINEYRAKDHRITYLRTVSPSGSPAVPRNMGIEHSKGRYIAFLDSDDVWFPNKLQRQHEFMQKNNIHLSYSFYEKMNWDGERNQRIISTRQTTTYSSLLKSNSIPCLTAIVSKEAIGDVRFKQIPQEDFCFWLDIVKKGYRAYNLCEVTALYRESKVSRSSNKIDMFKGYWNVIRNHQRLPWLRSLYCMIPYSILGFFKYIK